MNRADVIRLAREAGGTPYTNRHVDGSAFAFAAGNLDRFAALVEAEVRKEMDAAVLTEREACAMLVDAAHPFGLIATTAKTIRARTQPAPTGATKE